MNISYLFQPQLDEISFDLEATIFNQYWWGLKQPQIGFMGKLALPIPAFFLQSIYLSLPFPTSPISDSSPPLIPHVIPSSPPQLLSYPLPPPNISFQISSPPPFNVLVSPPGYHCAHHVDRMNKYEDIWQLCYLSYLQWWWCRCIFFTGTPLKS